MPQIETSHDRVTLINVFTVEPASQQRLVHLLVEATNDVMRNLPGFVSACIHRSDDGKRVMNYAQWRRRKDFEAMLKNPAAQKHMQQVVEIAQPDPPVYEVVETIEAILDRPARG